MPKLLPTKTAWLVGRCGAGADQLLAADLEAAGFSITRLSLRDLDQAADRHGKPDVALLCYAYPRAVSADVDAAAPVLADTPLLAVAGSWCEGQARTAPPPDGVPWCYWYEAADAADRISEDAGESVALPAAGKQALVELVTQDFETASMLADMLGEHGFAAAWNPAAGAGVLLAGATVSVWVGGQLHGLAAAELADACRAQRRRGAKTLVLLDFPRADEVALARQLGAAAVLAKPFRQETLCRRLRALTASNEEPIAPRHSVVEPVSQRQAA